MESALPHPITQPATASRLTWVGAYNGGVVLQFIGQERSSRILGGVWHANSGAGYVADLNIPGTKESFGSWGVSLGRFDDRETAKAAVIAAFRARMADTVHFDAIARVADRLNQPLSLSGFPKQQAA